MINHGLLKLKSSYLRLLVISLSLTQNPNPGTSSSSKQSLYMLRKISSLRDLYRTLLPVLVRRVPDADDCIRLWNTYLTLKLMPPYTSPLALLSTGASSFVSSFANPTFDDRSRTGPHGSADMGSNRSAAFNESHSEVGMTSYVADEPVTPGLEHGIQQYFEPPDANERLSQRTAGPRVSDNPLLATASTNFLSNAPASSYLSNITKIDDRRRPTAESSANATAFSILAQEDVANGNYPSHIDYADIIDLDGGS